MRRRKLSYGTLPEAWASFSSATLRCADDGALETARMCFMSGAIAAFELLTSDRCDVVVDGLNDFAAEMRLRALIVRPAEGNA